MFLILPVMLSELVCAVCLETGNGVMEFDIAVVETFVDTTRYLGTC
jgi:hypothetical protein